MVLKRWDDLWELDKLVDARRESLDAVKFRPQGLSRAEPVVMNTRLAVYQDDEDFSRLSTIDANNGDRSCASGSTLSAS